MAGRRPPRRKTRARTAEPAGPTSREAGAYLTNYVDALRESGVLRDASVEQAFRRVPRHLFIGRFFVGSETGGWMEIEHDPEHPQPEHLETIYSERALITRLDGDLGTSSSSQPALMADMLQLLDVRRGMRVLEIGAGTGYNAALLAELAGDAALVTTIDIQPDVVEQTKASLALSGYGSVRVLCRDGFEGAPETAPFDRIVATVGCPDLSPRWAEQLAPGGFMLIPLRHAGANPLVRVWRDRDAGAGELHGEVVSFSGFMAMQGALADPAYYDFTRPGRELRAGEVERPVWPDLGKGLLGFWFFLGVRDARTRMFRWMTSAGLKDGERDATARIEEDRLVGDPGLLDELDARYRQWQALGAPGWRSRWRVRFIPLDAVDADDPSARGANATGHEETSERTWVVKGTRYRRVFTLAPPDAANETRSSNGGA